MTISEYIDPQLPFVKFDSFIGIFLQELRKILIIFGKMCVLLPHYDISYNQPEMSKEISNMQKHSWNCSRALCHGKDRLSKPMANVTQDLIVL